jgi:Ca2+-transporting ATPase
MTVESMLVMERQNNTNLWTELKVEGSSYDPIGKIHGLLEDEFNTCTSGAIADIFAVAVGCNDAQLVKTSDEVSIIGEPTEGALLTLAEKLGRNNEEGPVDKNRQRWLSDWNKCVTLDFDRKRKSMGVFCKNVQSGQERLLVKGAPNLLFERCTHVKLRNGEVHELTDDMRDEFSSTVTSLSSRPLRCLLLAVKDIQFDQYAEDVHCPDLFESIETGLTVVGIVGIRDPPRKEALDSIRLCEQAGIRIAMITGDAKDTAVAIAKELTILPKDSTGAVLKAYEGKDFFSKSQHEQKSLLSSGNLVFYRAEPTDKQNIVKMLQSMGEVPAMTGDGVNDAPALRQANIGKESVLLNEIVS